MTDEELKHFGIMGMHWGKRSATDKYERNVIKNDKLQRKIEKKSKKLEKASAKKDKYMNKLLTTWGAPMFAKKRARLGRLTAKYNKKTIKLEKKIKKYKAMMESNANMNKLLKTKISGVDKERVSEIETWFNSRRVS